MSIQDKSVSLAQGLECLTVSADSARCIDADADAVWAAEAEDRLKAYRRGEVRAIPLGEALTKQAR